MTNDQNGTVDLVAGCPVLMWILTGGGERRVVFEAFVAGDALLLQEFAPLRRDGRIGEQVVDVLKVGKFGKRGSRKAGVIRQQIGLHGVGEDGLFENGLLFVYGADPVLKIKGAAGDERAIYLKLVDGVQRDDAPEFLLLGEVAPADADEPDGTAAGELFQHAQGIGQHGDLLVHQPFAHAKYRVGTVQKDGVAVFGVAVSKSTREIIAGPDVQMRGFLFLKDKEADIMLKEMTKMFLDAVNKWLKETKTFDNKKLEDQITATISKYLLRNSNRNPVVKPNVMIIDDSLNSSKAV